MKRRTIVMMAVVILMMGITSNVATRLAAGEGGCGQDDWKVSAAKPLQLTPPEKLQLSLIVSKF